MKKMNSGFFVLSLLATAPHEAFAIGQPDCPVINSYRQDSLRTHRLHDVEVRARRSRNSVTSVSPVQQIGREDIDLLGITSVGDAARRMAGVNVRDYGGIGGMQTVSVRSLGAQHTAVSYDGIVVSNMQAGQIDVSRFSPDNISRLSMAIGQSSDQMQSTRHYASAGILSIDTENPWEQYSSMTAKPWQMRLGVKTGSWGLLQPSLRYGQRMGQNTVFSVNANVVRADGVYPFTLVNGHNKEYLRRYNSDILAGQGEANLYHRWGGAYGTAEHRSELNVKAVYYNSKRGLPGVVILYNPDTRERMWDENFFVQSVFKTWLLPRLALHARLKYAHSWSKYEDYNVKYAGGKQTDVDRQDEYYASVTLGYDIARHWRIALAEDFTVGKLRNNIVSQPNPTRQSNQTALSLRWSQGRWQMDGNVGGTYISEHASAITDNKGSSVAARIPADRKRLSPSMALSYRLLPAESLYVRAMVKSTYRVPTFTDMYYLRIGNTNLKPENATEWNLGLTWAHSIGVGGDRAVSMQATVDGYYNRVTDKIVAFPSTYVWKMVNFGKASITGLDATLSLIFPLAGKTSLCLDATYTYQYAVDKTNPEKNYYGHQLPYTPRHSGNVSLLWKNPWVNVGWQMQAVGERWSLIQCTDEYRMKSYRDHSFTLSKDVGLGQGRMLKLGCSLLNAFNCQYEVIQYYPMPGRSFQASATIVL